MKNLVNLDFLFIDNNQTDMQAVAYEGEKNGDEGVDGFRRKY